MHAAGGSRRSGGRTGPFGVRKLGKPRLDRSEGGHETARLQERAAPAAAGRQIPIERLLVDLVHVEEAIGGALIEARVLDVLADNAGALLVAAAEEIGAATMVMMVVFVPVL